MKLIVSYDEIKSNVSSRFGLETGLKKVSENEILVTYRKHIILKTLEISVTIAIEEVTPTAVTFRYNGGLGLDMIITGLLTYMKSKAPELAEKIVPMDGHRVRLEYAKLKQMRSILKVLTIKSIEVGDDALCITADLK